MKSNLCAFSPVVIVRSLAFGLGLIGLVFAFRRKSRVTISLAALCLLVGVASLMARTAVFAVEAEIEALIAFSNSK